MRRLLLATTMLLGLASVGHASPNNDLTIVNSYVNHCIAPRLNVHLKTDVEMSLHLDADGVVRRAELRGESINRLADPEFRAYSADVLHILVADCATLQLPEGARGKITRIDVFFILPLFNEVDSSPILTDDEEIFQNASFTYISTRMCSDIDPTIASGFYKNMVNWASRRGITSKRRQFIVGSIDSIWRLPCSAASTRMGIIEVSVTGQ